jgi:hypothetical protein
MFFFPNSVFLKDCKARKMMAAKWLQSDEARFSKPRLFPVKISIGAGASAFNDTEHVSDKTINNTIFNTYETILDNDYMIEEMK